MNTSTSIPLRSKAFKPLMWLKRPVLANANMPLEIIPQGLVRLELNVSGWGWARLHGTTQPEPRQWFGNDQALIFFVSVGSNITLTLFNLWGGKHFQIDTTSKRMEVFKPHDTRFRFNLPDTALANLPTVHITHPSSHWRTWSINNSVIGPRISSLLMRKITVSTDHLFQQQSPNKLKIPKWNANLPMNDLNARIKRIEIEN